MVRQKLKNLIINAGALQCTIFVTKYECYDRSCLLQVDFQDQFLIFFSFFFQKDVMMMIKVKDILVFADVNYH